MSFKIPVLISYWVLLRDKQNKMLNFLIENKDRFRLVVDSGAFTAFTCGKGIKVEEYCAWVKDILIPASKKTQIDGYFQLDVIGKQEETIKNLKLSEKYGTNPIPIFTRATTLKDFVYMDSLLKDYSWVGIGAIKGTEKAYTKWVLENCKEKDKTHLLGFADFDYIRYYRPKSFDMSTWMNGNRFGYFYNPTDLSIIYNSKRIDFKTAKMLGFHDNDLAKLNDPVYRSSSGLLLNAPQASCCHAFLKQAMSLAKIDITSYLVCSSVSNIEMLRRSYEYFIENKPVDLFTKEI